MQDVATPAPPGSMRLALLAPRVALAVCVLAGVVIRLISLSISSVTLDGDEAVTGIMVRRILSGTDNYIYFAGQKYNGSLEQYLQAGMYEILRLPQNPFTLRLPQVALTAATTCAVYGLARLVVRSPWVAVIAAALYAAGPYFNIFSGTRTIGAYPSTQLIAVLGVIAVLRACGYRPGLGRAELPSATRDLWCAAAGFCAGLILWLSLSGLEVLAAAAIWLLPIVIRSLRASVAAAAGIIVGASPALLWMLRYPGQLPGTGGPQPATTAFIRAGHLYRTVAGEFVGISGPNGTSWWWPNVAQHVVVIALLIIWVSWAVVRRRELWQTITLRTERREPIDLILLIFPFVVLLYVVSPYTWFVGTPRYLFAVYPIFAVALAAAGERFVESNPLGWFTEQRRSITAGLAIVLIVLAAVNTTASVVHYLGGTDSRTSDKNIKQAVRFLRAEDDRYVYAQYWTAMPAYYLAAGTGVQIAGWDFGDRFADVLAQVDNAPQFAYLTSTRTGEDYGPAVSNALRLHNVTFRETRFGSATVFDQLSSPIRPADLGFAAG